MSEKASNPGGGSGSGSSFTSCPWFVESSSNNNNRHHYESAEEYAKDVQKWIRNASVSYYWHNVAAAFPYFLMQQMAIQQQQHQMRTAAHPPTSGTSGLQQLRDVLRPGAASWSTVFRQLLTHVSNLIHDRRIGNIPRLQNPALGRLAELRGREYKIPSLWKRFAAEFVDFAILFLLKLFFTFIAMDFFDMIDLEKFEDEPHDGTGTTIDYKFALQITSEIFILELIHRIVVCLFEALCLHQGTNGVGGATPGKSLLGLRVVSCESIQPLRGSHVLVWPARDIGFGWALLRSIIKNFSMALFIPACVTMLFFPFHRTVYDILCGCLVVEDVQQVPRM